jgi:hypothetical protein
VIQATFSAALKSSATGRVNFKVFRQNAGKRWKDNMFEIRKGSDGDMVNSSHVDRIPLRLKSAGDLSSRRFGNTAYDYGFIEIVRLGVRGRADRGLE